MKKAIGLFILMLASTGIWAQVQKITGRVYDEASGAPVVGAIVTVIDVTPMRGDATDSLGNFKIDSVPLGRHNLKFVYVTYETKMIPDVEVTQGKEVNLNVGMVEEIKQLKEVTVTYSKAKDKNNTVNDMTLVSGRSFNLDETKRYAGSLGDPSRMAANFAGVIAGNDTRNDIVVRGNSPEGMLWQIDGLNTPNPNHFGALNSTGGPISMLNNNNIDKSDFLTSAFPPQYGNALAGAFDIRLREGNHDKAEYVAQVGFNGFELGAEGPLGKNKNTSYLFNYRYSTLGVFKSLGIDMGTGGAVPLYQDLNYKIATRLNKKMKLTVFGIAGSSDVAFLGKDVDTTKADLYTGGDRFKDSRAGYTTTITGTSLDYQVSEKTSTRLVAGYCTTSEGYSLDSISNDYTQKYAEQRANFKTNKASLVWSLNHKFDAKNSLQAGANYDLIMFNMKNQLFLPVPLYDVNKTGNMGIAQAYAQWKHRFSKKLSLVAGLHFQYLDNNSSNAIEPRVAVRFAPNVRNAFSLGYGMHDQTQPIYSYFVQTHDAAQTMTNKNLDFTRSNHFVAGYDHYFTPNLRLKAEAFYQALDKVPVTMYASPYSAINEGISFAPPSQDSLVNKGTGFNYGTELTLEQFLNKGFYFLMTGSYINSRYKGSDGIERNTAYNTGYVANFLMGKEFKTGKNSRLSVNVKVVTIGGRYFTPLDTTASRMQGYEVYDKSKSFSEKQKDYFRADLKIGYKRDLKKSTMEFSLDLQNITNNKNIFDQSYDARKNQIVNNYQQGFFPVPMFRWTF